MKTLFKKSLLVLMVMFIAVISLGVTNKVVAAEFVETSFGEGKLFITSTFEGAKCYLPATTTSSGPSYKTFNDVSEIGEEHLWTITIVGSNYYIQNSEGKYLYTTNTNNGVRVGDTQHAWKYDASANSFQDTSTSRYLGVYNASNWRCYTTVNQSNYKESSTSFVFYKLNEDSANDPVLDNVKTSLDLIESKMSIAYKYTQTQEEFSGTFLDTITFDNTAKRTMFTTEQQVWVENGITVTNDKGDSTSNVGDYSNPARFYKSSSLKVESEKAFNTLEFTCSSSDYAGVLKNSITVSGATVTTNNSVVTVTLEVATNSFVIDSLSGGQVRMNSVTISGKVDSVLIDTFNEVDFRFKCGVDLALSSIENIDSWGIQISAGGSNRSYDSDSEYYSNDSSCHFVVVSLGDVLNNKSRLITEFTVRAFVVYDGTTYYSSLDKTYSVVSIIQEYYNNGSEETKAKVLPLYTILVEKGLISE